MQTNNYIYILIMIAVSTLIRTLPLTLLRHEIKNTFLRSFLHYAPYVTLAVMTFPAILQAGSNYLAGGVAFVIGVIASLLGLNLFCVSSLCCVSMLVMTLLL